MPTRSRSAARFLFALTLLTPLVFPPPARAGLADQVGMTFALMAEEFLRAFPAVEGVVVAVEGDRLFMDLSERHGTQEGQEFTVFRKGEVFRHPTTQKALGRHEEVLGHAQVLRVLPTYSEARYIPLNGKPRARPEDGVRITRGRIAVAVAPTLDLTHSRADLRRVPYLMAVTLERTKRFHVVDPQRVTDLFATERVQVEALYLSPDRFAKLGRSLEVSGWLLPVVLSRSGVSYLDVTWVSTVTGTPLFSKRRVLATPSPTEEQRFPWEPPAVD